MECKQAFVNSSLFHIGIIIVIEIILNFYTYIEKIGISMWNLKRNYPTLQLFNILYQFTLQKIIKADE